MKTIYIVSFLLVVACNKKTFKVPIGLTLSENKYSEMDSIMNVYDSLFVLNQEFKALGNHYLGKETNPEEKFTPYENSEEFKVHSIIDNNKVIRLRYYVQKKYNPYLYRYSDTYNNEVPYEVIIKGYHKELKTKDFITNNKEKLSVTFKNIFTAFTEKYGQYNIKENNNSYLERGEYNEKIYYWLKNGVKISLSFNSAKRDENFNPLSRVSEDGTIYIPLLSNYHIKFHSQWIIIEFEDIRSVKNKLKREEDEKLRFDIEHDRKINSEIRKKRRTKDSIQTSNKNKIIESL